MIDVKTLRIGSHILVDGERKEVKSISNTWIFLDNDTPYHEDHLEPIPLTAELLQELGFEHRESDSWMKRFEDNKNVFVDLVEQYALVSIFPHDKWIQSHVCIPLYLHSLESIVYHTIGKELAE